MLTNQQRRRISLEEQYDIPEEGAVKKKSDQQYKYTFFFAVLVAVAV